MTDLEWVQLCQKDHAWVQAIEYWLANGSHLVSDSRLQRCIEAGNKSGMTEMCWSELISEYPRADIADIAAAHGVDVEDL